MAMGLYQVRRAVSPYSIQLHTRYSHLDTRYSHLQHPVVKTLSNRLTRYRLVTTPSPVLSANICTMPKGTQHPRAESIYFTIPLERIIELQPEVRQFQLVFSASC